MVGVSLLGAGGERVAVETPGHARPRQPEGLEEAQPAPAQLLLGGGPVGGRRAALHHDRDISGNHRGQALLKPSKKHSQG